VTCVGWRTCKRIWLSVTAWYVSYSITRRWVALAASAACWHPHHTVGRRDSVRSSNIARPPLLSNTQPALSRRLVLLHGRAASSPLAASRSARIVNSVCMLLLAVFTDTHRKVMGMQFLGPKSVSKHPCPRLKFGRMHVFGAYWLYLSATWIIA